MTEMLRKYSEVRLINKPNHWKILGELKYLHLRNDVNIKDKDYSAFF